MPTYEYECTKGHRFEFEQSMHDPALKRCRICRSKVQRLISASAFILKGGGWYSDGYGSAKPGSNKSSGESSTESKSESTPASKPESKPEAKPESKPAAKADPKSSSKPPSGSAASTGS